MCSSAHQICDMWVGSTQGSVSERQAGSERARKIERERDTALSRLAWHNQFDTLHKVRTLDYCDWLLIKHLFWLASFGHSSYFSSSSSIGCWTLAQHAVRHVRHMPQPDAWGADEGREGREDGFKELRWVREKCHFVTWGREQGSRACSQSGQLLDFPKHQTAYSLIKCAIAMPCADSATGKGAREFSPFSLELGYLLYFWHTVRPAIQVVSGYD